MVQLEGLMKLLKVSHLLSEKAGPPLPQLLLL